MNEGLIPGRYAKALYKVASDKKQTEHLYTLMRSLADNFALNPELQATVKNPFVNDADKMSLLSIAAASDNDSLFADFLRLLSTNRRLSAAREIALAYLATYRKANDIHVVKIITADKLNETTHSRLADIVDRHLNGAKTEMSFVVDPEIIGGFVINIDSSQLDASISSELKQLRQSLISK